MRIPISAVVLSDSVEAEVLATIRSGQIAQGRRVRALEERVAALMGVRNVVAVSNGTAALSAALRSLQLPNGSEVITSPFTFVATVNACLSAGLNVRFADIAEEDFGLRLGSVQDSITENTRCLLPVHLYGQTSDIAALSALAVQFGLDLVEDAAQAFLARQGTRAAGSWGMGCFSLYATKNLSSGEGGLIATDDDDRAAWLRAYRNQGMVERYVYEFLGENLRMTDLQAAVALPQLETYEQNVALRRRNADMLRVGLEEIEHLVLPSELHDRHHVWHQFTILVSEDAPVTRDQLAQRLEAAGVGTGIYYPRLLGDYPHIGQSPRVNLGATPVAARVARTCLSLPVHPALSESDVQEVAEAVRKILRGST